MEIEKYVELSLKSAPMYAINVIELVFVPDGSDEVECLSAEEACLNDILNLMEGNKYLAVVAEVGNKSFEQIVSVEDIARVTIVDRPDIDVEKALEEIKEKEV